MHSRVRPEVQSSICESSVVCGLKDIRVLPDDHASLPRNEGFPGHITFRADTRKVLGKLVGAAPTPHAQSCVNSVSLGEEKRREEG